MSTKVTQGTTETACGCCSGGCLAGSFSCQTRGGTASLCGIEEYTSPSSPPKKYRTQTLSGDMLACFKPSGCDGGSAPRSVNKIAYDGTYVFSPTTCAEVNTQKFYQTVIDDNPAGYDCYDPGAAYASQPPQNVVLAAAQSFGVVTVTTSTKQTRTSPGTCQTIPGVAQFFESGAVQKELSDEDTEEAAITRLLASSSFAACVGSPCCVAQWEVRTSGFNFAYQEARWVIASSGLVPGRTYSAVIDYYRRSYGSGSYTLFQTDEVEATADSDGDIEFSGDVPNSRGFQTYAVQGTCPP